MRAITLYFDESSKVSVVARAIAACFGSLNCGRAGAHWVFLVEALKRGGRDEEGVRNLAVNITQEAIPEPGWPDPRRAEVRADGYGVEFITPGGVQVILLSEAEVGQFQIWVWFNRNSKELALQIAASLRDEGVCWEDCLDLIRAITRGEEEWDNYPTPSSPPVAVEPARKSRRISVSASDD